MNESIPTPVAPPMLEADNLTKRYEDGVLALDHISFSVKSGELFVMLGGNGAGKTTAINIFLNFLEPTDGEARIAGIATHRDPLAAKEKLAYVSENVMLYPNFTAMQNLEFFGRLGGRDDITKDELHQVLLRVGLSPEVHNKRLRGFSKGMRQKCGIAIAILKNAPAIVLDEPTSGLDPKAGFEFVELLASLRQDGKAILMSTHDIFRAREIADEIAILDRGKILLKEKPENLGGEDLQSVYMRYMGGRGNAQSESLNSGVQEGSC